MDAHLDRKILEIADTQKPVSVMMLDIDHFKLVNDTYGHASGDEVLKAMAQRISGGIRDFDLLARYGGEEFVVIMPSTPADISLMVAERLCRAIEDEPFEASGSETPLAITASIGVATTTDSTETAEALLGRADSALYQAKNGGRNQVCSAEAPDAAGTAAPTAVAAGVA
jgi:two-component system cell cycle response regulator